MPFFLLWLWQLLCYIYYSFYISMKKKVCLANRHHQGTLGCPNWAQRCSGEQTRIKNTKHQSRLGSAEKQRVRGESGAALACFFLHLTCLLKNHHVKSQLVPLSVCSHSFKPLFLLPAFRLLCVTDPQLYMELYVSENAFGHWQHLKQTR